MINGVQTITKSKTAEHLKKSPSRRSAEKKPHRNSTIRYIQGSLLDYLESSVVAPQKCEDA